MLAVVIGSVSPAKYHRVRSSIGRSVRYVAIVGGFFTVRASGPHPHCGYGYQQLTSYERTSAVSGVEVEVDHVAVTVMYIHCVEECY